MERVQKRWCARCLGLFRSIGPGGETVGEIRAMITDSQPHRSIGLKSKKKNASTVKNLTIFVPKFELLTSVMIVHSNAVPYPTVAILLNT